LHARTSQQIRLGLFPCLALFARVAAAETIEASRVVYSANGMERCPPPRDFEASVRERIRRGRLADEQEPAREYRVEMRAAGSRFVARLDFTEASGAERTREIASDTCADAASAIALVTALAIDAAGTEQRVDDGGTADGTLTPSEALGLVPPAPGVSPAPAASATPPPAVVAPAMVRAPSSDTAGSEPGVPFHLDAGLRGTLTTSKAPELLPGVELFAALQAGGAIPWLVDLGFAGERGGKEPNGSAGTRFSFLGARLRGCVLAWQPLPTLDVRPCAVIETGAVVAEGFIAHPQTQIDAWFAAGAAARGTLRIGPAALGAEVGPLFPITRNDYVFEAPERPAHEVNAVGFYASLGVALQIF
jgi:hypothetical protein